jgi:hypothetical protein
MFLARLEQAVKDSQRSTKVLHPVDKQHPPKAIVTPGRKSKPRMLHELNDYLFDLFDANMTEDFQIMQRFEDKAMEYYSAAVEEQQVQLAPSKPLHNQEYDDGDDGMDVKIARSNNQVNKETKGFSHEEYRLHQEFLKLFEDMIERFLRLNDYEADEVYNELLKYYVEKKKEKKIDPSMEVTHRYDDDYDEENYDKNPEKYVQNEALEVLDVLAFYTDFSLWDEMMWENARYRLQFRNRQLSPSDKITLNADSK